jgi:hypothetical protein
MQTNRRLTPVKVPFSKGDLGGFSTALKAIDLDWLRLKFNPPTPLESGL